MSERLKNTHLFAIEVFTINTFKMNRKKQNNQNYFMHEIGLTSISLS